MYDIIVVGGGPAGLTAGLYAARAGKRVLVLEGEALGGQIALAPLVENYPGLPKISGSAFVQTLADQVSAQGAEIRMERAETVSLQELTVTTFQNRYSCRALILATGAAPRTLNLPGEAELVGAGVSYCAVCDGAFYQNQPVAVVGGGSSALEEALFLSGQCSQVTLIHHRDSFRGEQRLAEQLRERNNISLLLSCRIEELLQNQDGLTGLRVRNLKTDRIQTLEVSGLFIAVGHQPRCELFTGLAQSGGYLTAGEDCLTSVPGVFAAGDCRAKEVRQLTTAAGDGAAAALAACRYLDQTEQN